MTRDRRVVTSSSFNFWHGLSSLAPPLTSLLSLINLQFPTVGTYALCLVYHMPLASCTD